MCDHHDHVSPPRRAISLDFGREHDRDHAAWSRRDFLTGATTAAAGAFLLGSGASARTVRASSHTPLLRSLGQTETDRVLVIIQLGGGNDGLNMVVPYTSDAYYRRRPQIGQAQSSLMTLDGDYGLNGAMSSLDTMWGDGDLAVVHSAGYPNHSRSHFRSTDIWASASDANEQRTDGWTGRYVDRAFPGHIADPLPYPVAIRIGGASSLLVRGAGGALGMSFSNPDQFDRLAQTGQYYDESAVPATLAGDELRFVREIYNSGLRYRDAVYDASQAGENDGEAGYPGGGLASSLASVARLIKGGLPSRMFAVSIGGFDTHSNQLNRQPGLLRQIAESVRAFYADLAGDGDRVLTMTFSEFGRTIGQNGAAGTDHAEASPLLLFGGGVGGGLYGDGPGPVLDTLPDNQNALPMSVDFRSVYASVLTDWFGLEASDTSAVLGGGFAPLAGLVAQPMTVDAGPGPDASLRLAVSPNPVMGTANVDVRLDAPAQATVEVVDLAGRTVRVLRDAPLAAGEHAMPFDTAGLAAGLYLVRLRTPRAARTVSVTVVR
ncbi:DUF1501 domain-containing protein [Rubrivirga sp. IMCC43871]|uniref:DUF1501 domain-containing protein n=1 Tax=Rubrivirga sp. IMCC43871 TaxID=3391575 RepID=UPI0039900F93